MAKQVPIHLDSRYKDTALLEDADGNIFMDLWTEPPEVADDRNSTLRHVPLPSDVGRLDLLSNIYYKSTIPWWAIASANGLRDQVEDMSDAVSQDPRKALVIPRSIAVLAFLGR